MASAFREGIGIMALVFREAIGIRRGGHQQ
jgi:hypothetical protein